MDHITKLEVAGFYRERDIDFYFKSEKTKDDFYTPKFDQKTMQKFLEKNLDTELAIKLRPHPVIKQASALLLFAKVKSNS